MDSTQANTTALRAMRPAVFTGAIVIALFFGCFGGWAAIAPLQSAAIAPGVLNVESSRKTIQHLEGGIVGEILISEGESVAAGQTLIRLDPVGAKTNLAQIKIRYHTMKALESRLLAERDGDKAIEFSDDGTSKAVVEAVSAETSIFDARRVAKDNEKEILKSRIIQFEEEMTGLRGQIAAQGNQISLINEELESQQTLFARKLVGKQRIIELKRERSQIIGSRNQQIAAIARIKQNIAEENLKILDLSTSQMNEVVNELGDVRTAISDLEERLVSASDMLTRTDVVSPLNGIVVNLQVHTIGGVIGAGETLMDIVPAEERLIVEARVDPSDIDSVSPGMTAQVVLTAFSRRTVAPLDGIVSSISADRLTDKRTGDPYYLARVSLPDDVTANNPDLVLSAGMQADAMIITGEHTPLQYIYRPIEQSFYRALREQ